MRYYIVDEDGNVSKTDDDDLVIDIVNNNEMVVVIDTEEQSIVTEDGGRAKIEDTKYTIRNAEEKEDDSDPGISDRERI